MGLGSKPLDEGEAGGGSSRRARSVPGELAPVQELVTSPYPSCPWCGRPNAPDRESCWGCRRYLAAGDLEGPPSRVPAHEARPVSVLAAAEGLTLPSYSDADLDYRHAASKAGVVTVVVALLLVLALALPWFTYGVFASHPVCSSISCSQGGGSCPSPASNPSSPFCDLNWYLPHGPAGAASQVVWMLAFLLVAGAATLAVVASALYGLMASGRGLRWKLGTVASLVCGSTFASAALAGGLALVWLWKMDLLWGRSVVGEYPFTYSLVTWGPGVGLYVCLVATLVAGVGLALARGDLGEGEQFFVRKQSSRATGQARQVRPAPTADEVFGGGARPATALLPGVD